ncbi:hypothetical protein SKAU_G00149050 [Synaphobranchus kaupii]|uniref:PLD phosphodiesterase domain-containing protein n=1 Tax=Synaphobranchus kaupii TaxID=118154 RepID=A0A9Q1FU48_SYNKA|nr:hypothetical protein SKAU_G00149050 [Synaphobranchus kaupii]
MASCQRSGLTVVLPDVPYGIPQPLRVPARVAEPAACPSAWSSDSLPTSQVPKFGHRAPPMPGPSQDRTMKSQQKCIVVFALVCCFAVLVALIFSAVDVWGDYEDGITEENCSRECRIVLVENIPEDLSFSDNGTSSLPLIMGLHTLLDRASRSVEIVSSGWALNSTDESSLYSEKQGQVLLQRLLRLKARQVDLKVASGLLDSADLKALSESGAEVRYLNMTALTKGQFHSSFWVVDRKHMYIGSGSMDWRSLSKLESKRRALIQASPAASLWVKCSAALLITNFSEQM